MQNQNTTINVKLAIRMNFQIALNCQLCDQAMTANVGAELVCEITNKPVCRACGIFYAPALAMLLNIKDSTALLRSAEQDYRAQVEFSEQCLIDRLAIDSPYAAVAEVCR